MASATLFALAGTLGAQTAETEPDVVFHVQILQAERAATDKLAAERVTLSKADFNANETINVHILALGGPTRSKLATFRRRNRL